MPNHPLSGIYYFFKGLALITKPGIRRWVFIPLFINISLFSGLIYYSWLYYQTFIEKSTHFLQHWLPDWEWLISTIHWLMMPLFMIITIIVIFLTFTLVANLISAPFNGFLATAVEKYLKKKPIEYPSSPLLQEIFAFPGIFLAKLFYYLRWVIILFIISLIPGVNLISPILWLLLSAWFVSLEYIDAPLGNYGFRPAKQRQILAKKRLLAFSFGSTVLVMMMIPIINFLVMPAAVAGATCLWVREFADETLAIERS